MGKITPNTHTRSCSQTLLKRLRTERERERVTNPTVPKRDIINTTRLLLSRKWLMCISVHKHAASQLEQRHSDKVERDVLKCPPAFNVRRERPLMSHTTTSRLTHTYPHTSIHTRIIQHVWLSQEKTHGLPSSSQHPSATRCLHSVWPHLHPKWCLCPCM